MKPVRILAILLLMCIIFSGCKNRKEEQKPGLKFPQISSSQVGTAPADVTFSYFGASMTLPPEFSDYSHTPLGEQYDFLYSSSFLGIYGTFVEKSSVEEITSVQQFAQDYAAQQQGEAVQKDGIWSLQYDDLTKNEPHTNLCAFYETQDNYWVITAYCPSQSFEHYNQDMWYYVSSATFE